MSIKIIPPHYCSTNLIVFLSKIGNEYRFRHIQSVCLQQLSTKQQCSYSTRITVLQISSMNIYGSLCLFCNTVTVRHYAYLKQWFDPLYFWANFWSLQDMSDWMLTTIIRFSASALCHFNKVLFYCKDAFLQSYLYYFLSQPLVAG